MRSVLRSIGLLCLLATPSVAQELLPRQAVIGSLDTGDSYIYPVGSSPDDRFVLYEVNRRGYIYWIPDTARVRVFDRQSRRSLDLLTNATDASWSPMGDLISFLRPEEGGERNFVWVAPVDPATGKLTGPARRIGRSASSGAADFSPDGKFLAFISGSGGVNGSSQVTVVPITGGAERIVLASGPRRFSARWSPDGKSLYYLESVGGPNLLFRVSATGGKPERVLGPANRFFGFSGDGKHLAYRADGINLIATVDGARIGSVTIDDDMPGGSVQWSSKGSSLLVPYQEIPTELTLVSIASGTVEKIPESDGGTLRRWFPDGSRFTFLNKSGKLSVFDPAAHHTQVDATWPQGSFTWSPDGKRILIRRPGSAREPITLLVGDAAKPSEAVALKTASAPMGATLWSPDSKQILYASADASGGPLSLRVFTVASGTEQKLEELPPGFRSIGWEPSGGGAYYLAQSAGATIMHRVQLGARPVERTVRLWDDLHPGVLRPMNDSLMMIVTNAGISLLSLQSGTIRLAIPRTYASTQQPQNFSSSMSATPDGKRITVVDFDIDSDVRTRTRHTLTVFGLDGKMIRKSPLDVPYSDVYNHDWLPNGEEFVAMAEYPTVQNTLRPRNGTDANGRDLVLVSAAGKPPRVVTSQLKFKALVDWYVSPDGRFIATQTEQPMTKPTQLMELDLSAALAAASAGKQEQ